LLRKKKTYITRVHTYINVHTHMSSFFFYTSREKKKELCNDANKLGYFTLKVYSFSIAKKNMIVKIYSIYTHLKIESDTHTR